MCYVKKKNKSRFSTLMRLPCFRKTLASKVIQCNSVPLRKMSRRFWEPNLVFSLEVIAQYLRIQFLETFQNIACQIVRITVFALCIEDGSPVLQKRFPKQSYNVNKYN